jgi:DNA-binding transcriptional LysR family regulator
MINIDAFVLLNRTMDFADLAVFKAVADEGGVTRAARRLHRVQSSVTTRIRQLEASLGTPLFIRERRRMVLSPAGQLFRGYAEELLALGERARAAASGDTPQGALRIGTLESTAASRLPAVLCAFHRAHPAVRVELATGTNDAIVEALLDRRVDAAFVAEAPRDPRIAARPAFAEELVLVTPRDHQPVESPRDVELDTVIAFPAGCAYRRRLERWLGPRHAAARTLELASYHAIVACVASGSGVALVPRSVLDTVQGGRNVRVHRLPRALAHIVTQFVRRRGEHAPAIDALQSLVPTRARTATSTRESRT